MRCHSCSAEIGEASRFCSSCGAALSSPDGSTVVATGTAQSSSASGSHGRFLPGTLLGGRFRIVAMLGRGGMGEVFRADDLKLGQPVALKFLSSAVSADAKRLERMYSEVRLARQVSHPNVCRVYDIGEVDGEHFLSMEYVEGEDLASLIRRIGRLPEAKGIDIARQIAVGLAAAHAKGIVHRDLKPSNVMIDERGIVRLTDFGLAAPAEGLGPSSLIEGTPAYMAPEQLAGAKVTHKSDIYALGLVMYEIFTGVRTFEPGSIGDLVKGRSEPPRVRPSDIAPGLAPSIDALIMRCLEPDPDHRPASALVVARELPGGDPLLAAIAAGQTPSPDMLAAAHDSGAMRVSLVVGCLVAIFLGVLMIGGAGRTVNIASFIDPQPAEVLVRRAREVAQQTGHRRQPFGAWRFEFDVDYITHIAHTDKSAGRWTRLRRHHPAPLNFWYRESPRPMIPAALFTFGHTTKIDPPLVYDGDFAIGLDSAGNLTDLYAPTPQIFENERSSPIDWTFLGHLSQIDVARFKAVAPRWAPLAWGDLREAKQGLSPDHGDLPLRLEAASSSGRIVSFITATPWLEPWRDLRTSAMPAQTLGGIVAMTLFLMLVVASLLLARRNFRLGRGDRRGAFRLAYAVFVSQVLIAVLTGDHWPSVEEIGAVIAMTAPSLLLAAFSWILYVAVEPYVRRCWPHALVSWNRVLLLQFRDPLVGRDILAGLALGTIAHALRITADAILVATGSVPETPRMFDTDVLLGFRRTSGLVIDAFSSSLVSVLVLFALLYVLRLILRRDFIAIGAISAILGIFGLLNNEHPAVYAPLLMLQTAVLAFVTTRVGIVAAWAWLFANSVYNLWPMILDPSSWAFGHTLFAAVLIGAIAVYAFQITMAGRTIFKDVVLEA